MGAALEFACSELKADRDVVVAAVKHDGWALEHASDVLKSDKEIVATAVQQKCWASRHANQNLQQDGEVQRFQTSKEKPTWFRQTVSDQHLVEEEPQPNLDKGQAPTGEE